MPTQIKDLDEAELSRLGLAIPREQLWNETGGLLRAAVNLSGCSAAFVSKDGLIATNHHCAHPSIQANSDVAHDYLKDGFLAKDRAAELPGKDLTVRVLEKIDDSGYGKLAWVIDPEGNKVELWEPPQGQ